MKILFKNITALNKDEYLELIKFHGKKNNLKYYSYTAVMGLILIIGMSYQIILKNYVSFGAKVIRFEDFDAVDIVVHADKKLYKNANEFIGLAHQAVKEFFETFEDYLSKNNMQDKDLEIVMPIEFEKNKKENILSRIRKYIKNI